MNVVVWAGIAVFTVSAQIPGDLSSVARQERNRQAAADSARVYNNENVGGGDRTETPAAPAAPAPPAAPAEAAAPETADGTGAPRLRTEPQWRTLFADARAEIERSRNLVTLAEKELDEVNHRFLTRSDIYNREYVLQAELQEKREALESARTRLTGANAALNRLTEELRRAGAPPGWGR